LAEAIFAEVFRLEGAGDLIALVWIMARFVISAASFLAAGSAAKVALDTYEQGAAFEKCISIADFESKTLADEIDLIDMVDGCCPEGSVPGAKSYSSYTGAQVVCGFKADGAVALSTGSSNGAKTCTYNSCYVEKQNLPCADGTKQLLNGCCKATTKNDEGFEASCKNYWSSFNNAWSEKVQYCTTYHKDYSKLGYKGTTDKTDDQADGKLIPSKIYAYTPCGVGAATPTPAPAGTASGARAVVLSSWFFAAFAARF